MLMKNKTKQFMKKSNRSRNWEQEERKEKEGHNSWASMCTFQQKQSIMDTSTEWGYGWQVWWIL
jgi:hypothetical protein